MIKRSMLSFCSVRFFVILLLFQFISVFASAQTVGGMLPTDDFDGDGIINSIDLDDDNDGIPDTDEYCKSSILLPATNTKATVTEFSVPAGWTITNSSPDIATTAYSIYGNWIGGCSGTAPAAPNGHNSWVNFYSNTQEAFKTTLSGLVVGRKYIFKVYYAKFASTAALGQITVKLGTSVIDQYTPTLGCGWETRYITFTATTTSADLQFQNTGIVSPMQNASISVSSDALYEICDTDNDGIPNQFDLDSDGDGCPDAREAGVTGTLRNGDMKNGANGGVVTTTVSTAGAIAGIANSYGANGLADALETVAESGIINYTSTYSNYALSSNTNICSGIDTDGDGIPDLVDLDDDNDGVLDVVENAWCKPLTGTTIIPVGKTYGVTAASFGSYLPAVTAGLDATTCMSPGQVTTLTYDFGKTVKNPIIGFYGVDFAKEEWFDLNDNPVQLRILDASDPTTVSNNILTLSTNPVAGANTAATSAMGRVQVFGNVTGLKVKHTWLLTASNCDNHGFSFIEPTECLGGPNPDTDNDGIINSLDLDSDGDGCFDAIEAGVLSTTSTGKVTGTYGSNGFANSLETVADNGIYNAAYSYSYAIYNKVNACLDSDGDGVKDIFDLDDDNDGILDDVERSSCSSTPNYTFLNINGTTAGALAYNAVFPVWMKNSFTESLDGYKIIFDNPVSDVAFEFASIYQDDNYGDFTVKLTDGTVLNNIDFDLSRSYAPATAEWTPQPDNTNNFTGNFSRYIGAPFSPGMPYFKTSVPNTGSTQSWGVVHLKDIAGASTIGIAEVSFKIKGGTTASGTGGLAVYASCFFDLDSDKDGIPNRLDLDSDGDGCPDAVEAGTTIISTSGVASSAKLTTSVIPSPYGNNGFANGLETAVDNGIYKGTYTYSRAIIPTINGCTDTDTDGVADMEDLDDDNDGVLDCAEGTNIPLDFSTPIIFTDRPIDASGYVKYSSSTPVVGQQLSPPAGDADGNIGVSVSAGVGNKTSYSVSFNNPTSIIIRNNTKLISGYVTGDEYFDFSTSNGSVIALSDPAFDLQVFIGSSWVDVPANYSATTIRWRLRETSILPGSGTFAFTIQNASSFTFYHYNNNASNNNGTTLNISRYCVDADTDNDGIPNRLDLDSDGDGCTDAVEAGVSGSLISGAVKNGVYGVVKITTTKTNAIAAGPYGLNGLADGVETALESGLINYNSTYDPYALSANLAFCRDTDGDGIIDLLDIDDDNDGVLDAEESPSCFMSSADWNTTNKTFFAKVTSELTTLAGYNNFVELTDNDGASSGTKFSTTTAQSQLNKAIFKIEFSSPTQLDALYIQKNDATQIFAATASSLKLQGSTDNSTWTDLTAALGQPADASYTTANGARAITNSNKFIVTTGAGKYKYYRIYGLVAANILSGTANEIFFDVNNATYQASYYPKADCSNDTDGDGILNHQDLDSDGDGCSDAIEAKSSTTATSVSVFPTGTDTNNNGLLNVYESATAGVVNYTSVYNPYATSNNLAACRDTDGDGIPDNIDLDDDNDGILDAIESPQCFYTENDYYLGPRPDFLISTELTMVAAQSSPNNLVDGFYASTNLDVRFESTTATLNTLGSGKEVYRFNLQTPVKLEKIYLAYANTNTNFAASTNLILRGSNDGTTWTNLSATTTYDNLINSVSATETSSIPGSPQVIYANIFSVTQNPAKYQYYDIFWSSGGGISSGGYANEVFFDVAADFNSSAQPKISCNNDTDGDGILNHQDLDSDGDGCPDAKEAGITANLTAASVINLAGATIASGTATSTMQNAIVAGTGSATFGNNGFVNTLETSSESGIYSGTYNYNIARNKNINACTDTDGDGVPDVLDLDDDNDGVLDQVECPPPGAVSLVPRFDISSGASTTKTITGFPEELWIDVWNIDNNLNLKINNTNITTVSEINFAIGSTYTLPYTNVVQKNGLSLNSPNNVWLYGNTQSRPMIRIKISQYGEVKLFGLDGTNGTGNYQELVLLNAKYNIVPINITGNNTITLSQNNEYPPTYLNAEFNTYNSTGFCDTDGDGVENRLDLDSDNDGCSDAYEAKTTTNTSANFKFDNTNAFGTNGFLNSLETVADNGIYKSNYTYDFAIDARVKSCLDSDADGVPDIYDLDDDNDGILDAVESPTCFYTLSELAKPASVSSDLKIYNTSGTYDLANSIDGLIATYAAFTSGQYITNKEIIKYTANGLIAINSLTLNLDFRAISTDANSTFKLQASDDNVLWDDLSNAPISSTVTVFPATLVLNNDLQPTKKYKYFRLYGVAGTNNYGGIAEATFNLATNTRPSSNPKLTCTNDTDGDGIPNQLDLDSDGDGCPDAKEAGVTGILTTGSVVNLTTPSGTATSTTNNVANAIAAGTYSANGFADALETATESGIYSGTYYYDYAINKLYNGCTDTDGDGVPDLIDIDDDNDGILDAIESPTCFYNSDELAQPIAVTTELAPYSTYVIGNSIDGNLATISAFAPSVSWVNKELFKLTALKPIPISGLSFTLTTWAISGGSTGNTFKLQGSNDNTAWTDLSSALSSNETSGIFILPNSISPNTKYLYYRAIGVAGTSYYGGVTEVKFITSPSFITSQYTKPTCTTGTTDGDIIPNHLDLDSDGDGCSDALESGTTSITTTNYKFTGSTADFGANGFLNTLEKTSAESNLYKGVYTYDYATNAAYNYCTDSDGDGVPDLIDLDNDNDGILDAIESPTCFYTLDELSNPASVSSALSQYTTSYVIGNSIDGIGATASAFSPNQDWVGKEIFNFTAKNYIVISGMSFDLVNWALSSATASTFKLQGSGDNVNWIDLSAATYSTATTGTFTISNTLATTSKLKYYRLVGVAGTSGYGGVYEARFNLPASASPSANPKPTCTNDTDSDGIFNQNDLDSDGDGCADAKEAGILSSLLISSSTLQNAIISGTGLAVFGNNGFANALETSSESGIYSGTYNYTFASLANINACIDTDNDGVPDILDIDDDNDGITDLKELNCTIANSTDGTCTDALKSASSYGIFTHCSGWNAFDYDPSSVIDRADFDYMGINGTDPYFDLQGSYAGPNITGKMAKSFATAAGLSYTFEVELISTFGDDPTTGSKPYLKAIDASTGTILGTTYLNGSGIRTVSFTAIGSSTQITLGHDIRVGNIGSRYWKGGKMTQNGEAYQICTLQDTDNDGVPNQLDLDSDGDGCPDAVEAGTTLISTSGVASSAKLTTSVIPGPYGANGFANGLETASESGKYTGTYTYIYAINASTNACLDSDGDGVTDVLDLDDDNDGVLDAIEQINCTTSGVDLNTLTFNGSSITDKTANSFTTAGGDVWKSSYSDQNLKLPISLKFKHNSTTGYEMFGLIPAATTQTPATWTDGGYKFYPLTTNAYGYFTTAWDFGPIPISPTDVLSIDISSTGYVTASINGVSKKAFQGTVSDYKLDLSSYRASSITDIILTDATRPAIFSCSDLDSDSDGIPNRLDLDSDGDGCPDAVEAGTTAIATSGVASTAKLTTSIIPAPYGNNGFANGLETASESGLYSGTYTYNYATDATVNACTDSDGDGVPDLLDLDDDNDGVLDYIECTCKSAGTTSPVIAPSAIVTVPVNVFELSSWGSHSNLAYDGSGLSATPTTEASLSNITHSSPTLISNAAYTSDNTSVTNDWLFTLPAVSDIKGIAMWIPGSNAYGGGDAPMKKFEISWINCEGKTKSKIFDLGTPSANVKLLYFDEPIMSVSSIKMHVLEVWYDKEMDQGVGNGWEILDAANVLGSFNITLGEIRFIGQVGPYKILKCNMDSDGDGIPNNIDLDSDGDGCPDAVEAGTVYLPNSGVSSSAKLTTSVIPAPYGANGFANGLETASESGLYSGTYTYNYATDATLSACKDTDGDGVPDLLDLDDDNDGVLDIVECPIYVESNTCNNWIAPTNGVSGTIISATGETVGYTITANSGVSYRSLVGVDFWTTTMQCGQPLPGSGRLSNFTGAAEFTITFDRPVSNAQLLTSATETGVNEGLIITTNASSQQTVSANCNSVNQSLVNNQVNQTTLVMTGDYGVIRTIKEASYTSLNVRATNNGGGLILALSLCSLKTRFTCDIDNDGIPNQLDLDSDGDGCPDAKEAGVNGTLSSGSVKNGSAGAVTSTTTLANAIAAGPYGANGLADGVETATESGVVTYTSTYATNALVKDLVAPTISTQPLNKTVFVGSSVVLTTTAGTPPANRTLTYQWYKAGVAITGATSATYTVTSSATTSNADNYYCTIGFVNSCLTTNSNSVNVTVLTNPVGLTACQDANAVLTVTKTGTNTVTYQWKKATTNLVNGANVSGATTATLALTNLQLTDAGAYYLYATDSYGNTINSLAGTITITNNTKYALASSTTICATTSTVNLVGGVVSGTSGATSTKWQRSLDGGATWVDVTSSLDASITYTNMLTGTLGITASSLSASAALNGYQYRIVTSNATCTNYSNIETLNIGSAPVITAQPSNSLLCNSFSTSFTAAATGVGLTYQWQTRPAGSGAWTNITVANANTIDAGVVYSNYATATLNLSAAPATENNNQYQVVFTNSCGTVTSTTAILNPTVVTPTLSGANVSVCSGTPVTLTASSSTASPTYQWYLGGTAIGGATNATFNPTASGSYSVIAGATGYCSSATASGTVTINPPPTVTIAQGAVLTLSSGGSIQLTANPLPSGTYSYIWYNNGVAVSGQTASIINVTSVGTYTVKATNISTTCNATSAATVIASLPAPSVNGSTTICSGGAVGISISLGSGQIIQWESSTNGTTWTPINGANNASYNATPTNNTNAQTIIYYHAVITAGTNVSDPVGTSNAIGVTVNPLPTATIVSSNSSAVCVGTAITLTATTNATNPVYTWFNNGNIISGATASTYSTSSSGVYNFSVSDGNTSCAAGSATSTVTIVSPPAAPNLKATSAVICVNASADLTLYQPQAISGVTYEWHTVASNPTSADLVANPNAASAAGTYYLYAKNNSAGCYSTASVAFTLTVNSVANATLTSASNQNYTVGDFASALTAATTNPTYALKWYASATGGVVLTSPVLPSTSSAGVTNYYVEQYNPATYCASASRVQAVVTVKPLAPTITNATYCQNTTASALNATAVIGGTLNWYSASTGGSASSYATVPSTSTVGTTNYYVSQTVNGVESDRAVISVTVNQATPTPSVVSGNTTVISLTTEMYSVTNVANTTYQWTLPSFMSGSATTNSISALINGAGTGYVSVIATDASGCPSAASRTSVQVQATAYVAPPPTTSNATYTVGDPTIPANTSGLITGANGSTINYYSNPAGSSSSNQTIPTNPGTYTFYASQTINGVESALVPYTITIKPLQPIVADITYCQNEVAFALTATGTSLKWYTVSAGGTATPTAPIPSTGTATNTTYYVTQTIGGVESDRIALLVTINPTPSAPSSITGATTVLAASSQNYSVTNDVTVNNYNWTLPSGWTGTSTINSINATVGNSGGQIIVTATNGACTSPATTLTIAIAGVTNPPATSNVTFVTGSVPSNIASNTSALISPDAGATLNYYTSNVAGTASTTSQSTPTTPGVYTYYVSQTIVTGGLAVESILVPYTVTVKPIAPPINTNIGINGNAILYCKNSTAFVLTATTSVGGTLKWYTVATGGTGATAAPTPSTSIVGVTNYYVSQTVNGVESDRSLITVTINDLPGTVIAAANSQPTCSITSGSILVASPLGTGFTYSVDGMNYTNTTLFTTLPSGSYNVTAQNSNGCISAPTSVIINPALLAPLAPITSQVQPTCANQNGTITVQVVNNTDSYSIDGGLSYQSNNIFTNVPTGSYNVTVKNASGCISAGTNAIINAAPSIPAQPNISTSANGSVCVGTSVTLTSTISTGNQWYKDGVLIAGAINNTFVPLIAGNYTVVVTNANGCSSPASPAQNVTFNPIPVPTITEGATLAFNNCSTTTITLSATNAVTANGNTYQWYLNGNSINVNGNNASYNATQAGNYSVAIINNGCIAISPISKVIAAPSLNAANTAFCAGSNAAIPISGVNTGFANPTYQWQISTDGGTTFTNATGAGINSLTYTATTAGSYQLVVTDGGVTSTSCPIAVTQFARPNIIITSPPTNYAACAGSSVVLTALANSGTASYTYQWFNSGNIIPNATSTTYTTTLAGNYGIQVTDANGCIANAAPTNINILSLPAAPTIVVTNPTCSVTTGTISVTAPLGTGYTYSIDGINYNNTTGLFTGVSSGNYSVTVKSAAGCIGLASNATVAAALVVPAAPVFVSPVLNVLGNSLNTYSVSPVNGASSYTWIVPNNWTGVSNTNSITIKVDVSNGPLTVVANSATCSSAPTTINLVISKTNPDINVTDINVPVSGNLSTNDNVPVGTSYGQPAPNPSNPAGGTITVNSNGTYTFTGTTPGKYVYYVPVCAPGQTTNCPLSPLEITVIDPLVITDKPVANNDFATTKSGTPVTVNILANDAAGNNGGTLNTSSISVATAPKNGTVVINIDGTVTYTPAAGFVGTDSVSYNVCDNTSPTPLCQKAVVYFTVIPVAAPSTTTAVDDYVSILTSAGGTNSVSGNALTNDKNSNGSILTASIIAGPSNAQGAFTMNANGTYTFTPTAGFSGPVDITYTACTGATPAACASATIHILVETAQVVNSDVATAYINVPASGNISTNDVVLPGTTYGQPAQLPGATITVNPDGTYTFTATAAGTYTYTIPVCAPGQTTNCPTQTLVITVPVNTLVDDASSAYLNVPASGNISTNDLVPSGTTYGQPAQITGATITVGPNGTYTFTATVAGTYTYTVPVCAPGQTTNCPTETLVITVPVNTLVNDAQTAYVNIPTSGNISTNDVVPTGTTYGQPAQITGATITFGPNGTYTFTTTAAGTYTYTVPVCAPGQTTNCSTETLVITVPVNTLVNDAQTAYVNIPTSGNISTNDVVPTGTTYGQPAQITGATITVGPNGTYTFTATAAGTYTYTVPVCAPGQTTNCPTEILVITVPVNTLVNDAATAYVNLPKSGNISTNDVVPAGTTYGQPAQITGATITVGPNGTYTFTATAAGTYTYTVPVCAPGQTTNCPTETLVITVPVNTLTNDTGSAIVNIPTSGNISTNDVVPAGTTYGQPAQITGATITVNANGTYSFTATVAGTYTYIVPVCAPGQTTNCPTETLVIVVTDPTPPPPVVINLLTPDFGVTAIAVPLSGNLNTNDNVPTGTTYGQPATNASNPTGATIVVNPNGTYTFNATKPGTYTYYVPVCTAGQTTGCPLVPLVITVVDPMLNTNPPIVNPDIATTIVNTPVTTNVLANDKAANSGVSLNPASVSIASQPKHGTVIVNADGTITYTPANGFVGTDSLTYNVCDNSLPTPICKTGVVYYTVNPATAAPATIAADDFAKTPAGNSISGNVLLNDKNTGGASLTVTSNTTVPASKGVFVINANGTYSFTPAPGFTGPIDIVYTVCGGTPAVCTNATLHILVEPVIPIKILDITKVANSVKMNLDGSFNIEFAIKVKNLTTDYIDSVLVKDDLTKVFTDTRGISILSVNASGKLIKNNNYDGIVNTDLLLIQSALDPKKEDSIILILNLQSNQSGNFANTAIVNAPTNYGMVNLSSTDPTLIITVGDTTRKPTLFIIPKVEVVIPGGFSPNNDGIDDAWIIKRPYGTNISVKVFNRWGNEVYSNANYQNNWRGKGISNFIGEDVPEGTYYYIVEATDEKAVARKFAASLTIVR